MSGFQAATALLLSALAAGAASARAAAPPAERATLAGHDVVLDREGRLLSWAEPQETAYGTIARLAWEQLLTGFPVEENGFLTWLTYCCFDGETRRGGAWPHNPASFYAGLAQGAAAYHAALESVPAVSVLLAAYEEDPQRASV